MFFYFNWICYLYLHKNKLMLMSIDIFKTCTQTPKSGKIFWKGQGKVREFWKVEVLDTLKTLGWRGKKMSLNDCKNSVLKTLFTRNQILFCEFERSGVWKYSKLGNMNWGFTPLNILSLLKYKRLNWSDILIVILKEKWMQRKTSFLLY